MEHGEAQNVVTTIQTGGEIVDTLVEKLIEAWGTYEIRGAVAVYDWHDDLRQVIGTKAAITSNSTADDDYYDDDDDTSEKKPEQPQDMRKPPVCLRAIDHLLVMNVLARTRSGILLSGAQLSLESGFLERSLISDDPRLVALARATGCLEEQIMV
jgi:hypothetical protein